CSTTGGRADRRRARGDAPPDRPRAVHRIMSAFRGRVALVTGAAGFAGAHVSRALSERGARVHGLGSEPPRGPLALEGWHAADVRDPAAIESVLTTVKPDLVVHLAGQASAGRSF